MLLYIEMAPESLDLIATLNNGVVPENQYEDEINYFVYDPDPNHENVVIGEKAFENSVASVTQVTVIPVVAL